LTFYSQENRFIDILNKTDKLEVLRPNNTKLSHAFMTPVIRVSPAWEVTVKVKDDEKT